MKYPARLSLLITVFQHKGTDVRQMRHVVFIDVVTSDQ
jgi:hypothetical protein